MLECAGSAALPEMTPESIYAVKVNVHSPAMPIVGSNEEFSGDVQCQRASIAELLDTVCQRSFFGGSNEVNITEMRVA